MPSPLEQTLSKARNFRSFLDEPRQIANQREMDRIGLKRAKIGLAGAEMGMDMSKMDILLKNEEVQSKLAQVRESKWFPELLRYEAAETPEQREMVFQEIGRKMQISGEDMTEYQKLAQMPPEMRDGMIRLTIAAAERSGKIKREKPEKFTAPKTRTVYDKTSGENILQSFNQQTGQWEAESGIGPERESESHSPTAPSAVREHQYFKNLSPEEQKVFMSIKRAAPSAKAAEFGGKRGVLMADGTFIPISSAAEEIDVEAEKAAATTRAKEETKADVERTNAAPERAEKARQLIVGIDNVIDRAVEAQGLVGYKTTGFGGLLSVIPMSDARELSTLLTTIQANLGFDRLQKMREASPTGGALGQVSERELDFLQSSVQNLDNKVEPSVLKKRLQEIVQSYGRWKDAIIDARGSELEQSGEYTDEQILEILRKEFPSAG